jgi:outer membrane biosynthesis protein TonB
LQNSAKGKRRGILGTTIVHLMLFGMLILVGFSTPPAPDTEGGILVNFGTGETGIGDIEPSPPAFKEESSVPPVKELATPPQSASKSAVKPEEDPLLSQNAEEAPVVKKTPPVIKKIDPEAAKKRLEKIEADRKLNEQLEAERVRVREEEAEKKRIAAEQKRESDIMNRTKNALANSQNRGTTSTGEGVAGGPGNQGDPNGSINSKVRGTGSGLGTAGTGTGTGTGDKGISYDLGGREIQALPRPKYEYQTEGKVVVDVSVDRSGKVVQAVPGGKGSSTLNEDLLRIAKEAAMGAKFKVKQDAPPIQKGTITYVFILKQ